MPSNDHTGADSQHETAADVADALVATAQPFVDDAVNDASFLLIAILMVPVGLAILILSFVVMAVVTTILHPAGPLASVVTIGWLLATLGALFLAFRRLYRRLPRRLRAGYAGPIEPRVASAVTPGSGRPPAPINARTPAVPAPTLAELDARLAPRPAAREDR